ncbi:MAG: PfaB family protein [Colwellia sp.]
MLTNHRISPIAIIGLDAQFVSETQSQANIDRVERALYLGKEQGKVQGENQGKEQSTKLKGNKGNENSADILTIEAYNKIIARMAQANKLDSSTCKVVVISEQMINIENAVVVSSLSMAIEQVQRLIEQNHLVALVGLNSEANLANTLTNNSAKNLSSQFKSTISFDQFFDCYQHCYGVAALLFSSKKFAETNESYIYSWLNGFACSNKGDVEITTTLALKNAQVTADEIGLLEVSALACSNMAKAESLGLLASYANNKTLNTAVSCARSVTGEGAAFSQVLGLLRSVIALQQRYIPAISDWQQPVDNALAHWQNSSFYVANESRPWYPHKDNSAHIAAYSCLSANNDYCHLVLSENQISQIKVTGEKHPLSDIRQNGFLACSELKLVLISGNDRQALLTQLDELATNKKPLHDIALNGYVLSKEKSYLYTVALVCESKEALIKESQLAKSAISALLGSQINSQINTQTSYEIGSKKGKHQEWRTPRGSYFTATPVNHHSSANNVSFLYPGIGATYVGLGRDLLHLFPEIYPDVTNLADDIAASLKDTLLNPRTISRPDFKTLKQLDVNLRNNLADIAEAGVGFACVFTKIFENVFKIKADYAAGYSMGEVSMYAALGAWQQPGLMSARLANSDTFNHRLCGDLLTLREHWGLPESTNKKDDFIWETYTVKATLSEVIAASEGEDRVYCTIINTPDSLLLAGYPEDCLRVINKLGVRAMPLTMANVIHSAPANKEYDDMVELYTMAVTERLNTKMYSSSCYLPIPQLSNAIAHSVAKCLCDRVDFPRLINAMHSKGAQIFIEMGPGRSLSSWVDKILSSQAENNSNTHENHSVAVPVNAKGTSDELTYLRAIAKLISHGVKLDLNSLFKGSIIVNKA